MSLDLVTLIDDSGSLTFVGQAFPVPGLVQSNKVWKILRIDSAASGTTFLFADNNPTFTKSWSDRASLTYSIS